MSVNTLILCPTARLARSIQHNIAKQHLANSETQWQTPQILTLGQWLQNIVEVTLLSSEIRQGSTPKPLCPVTVRLVWEEVIADWLKKNTFGDLFDISGLAGAAAEANRYMIAWKLHVSREHQAEEVRQFLQWQRAFQQRCDRLHALESVRYMDWQLTLIAKADTGLPKEIAFAGFDLTAPQESRLRELLTAQGVAVSEYPCTLEKVGKSQHVSLQDQEAEARAVVAWAQRLLQENPQEKLAIVVPQLAEIRNRLADLLDDIFYPHSVRPSMTELARNYNFSLGTPLIEQLMVQTALNLLRLLSTHQITQEALSKLIRTPFWSANVQEADARAQLDAMMREKLPMQMTLAYFVTFATQQHEQGLRIPQLLSALQAAITAIPKNKHLPSDWAQHITALLTALQWPGERSITSLEYQVQNAWQKALQQLTQLDILGKKVSFSETVHHLHQICEEQVFQPETEGERSIQILGIMEALSTPVDALWVMHMNDHIWPPPARPNALIPAFIQRAAKVPGADNHVQAEFARTIHQRLLHSAKQVIFSSSMMHGDSQLRASPLMADIPVTTSATPLAETMAERLSHLGNRDLSFVQDHTAPPVATGEHVGGGTGLFKAQAACPAWAFYQYRLGAKALKTPSSGLDNLARGSLVHGVLEHFWGNRHYADLRDMPDTDFNHALQQAVEHSLTAFVSEVYLSTTLLELEQERLTKLVGNWLQFEKARGVGFRVISCEKEQKTQICGIEIKLKVDRIHALEDGSLEFVDYKTGQTPKTKSWSEHRITEPQLPIYACFFGDGSAHISGVQFGMVKTAAHEFSGINQADFADEKNRKTLVKNFASWEDLLTHWRSSIEAIAIEIQTGEASVRVQDESDLTYCDVLPILRLPERQLQFERFSEKAT